LLFIPRINQRKLTFINSTLSIATAPCPKETGAATNANAKAFHSLCISIA